MINKDNMTLFQYTDELKVDVELFEIFWMEMGEDDKRLYPPILTPRTMG